MGKSASLAAFTMTDTSASEVGLTEKFLSKLHISTPRRKFKAIIFSAEIIKCWSDSKLAILFKATFHSFQNPLDDIACTNDRWFV